MSTNDLVAKVCLRARQLADLPMSLLRKEPTAELRMTRGQLIEAQLMEEFWEEFPKEICDD